MDLTVMPSMFEDLHYCNVSVLFRKSTCPVTTVAVERMTMTKDQAAEVERLESEARAKAAKHVANMLARPDQLEKVHQLTWRVSRWVPQ